MLLIKKLVAHNRGIGVCLRFALQEEDPLSAVSFDPPVLLQLGLAWRKDRYLSAANRAFVNFVCENADHKIG